MTARNWSTDENMSVNDDEQRPSFISKFQMPDVENSLFETGVGRLRLIQPSQEEEFGLGADEQGMFYLEGLDEPVSEITLIPLDREAYREYRQDDFDESDGPDCISSDGVTGHGNPGGACRDCPLSRWHNGAAPKCVKVLTYQFREVESEEIVLFTFRRKAHDKAGKRLNSMFDRYGAGNFAVQMRGRKDKSRNGQVYFVPQVRKVDIPED